MAKTPTVPKNLVAVFEDNIQLHSGEDAYDALSIDVIFRKRALKLVALLHKHNFLLKASYGSSLPCTYSSQHARGEVGGWGRDPFSRNLMSPTPRRKWYLTTGRRFH